MDYCDPSLESLVAALADEFMDRQRRGERPSVEQFSQRYPQHATVLRQVLSSLELVQLSSGCEDRAEKTASGSVNGLLGDFRIIREIGRGGMGIVYEAKQLSLNRRVALKVLPFAAALDPRQLYRFQREAEAAAHLHHTNIVPVFGVFCERGVHFYAMQFIEGRTLANVITELRGGASEAPSASDTVPIAGLSTHRSGRRAEIFRTIALLGVQAAEALEHAHREGVIHRDVKPANLLVDASGNLWITDFGLARLLNEQGQTMSGDLVGTLRYMSPEQASVCDAPIDHRADIYSLGATLYELLTFEPVFDGRGRSELLRQIAAEEPRPLRRLRPIVPMELETIVLKALDKEPARRYSSAQDLADDLRRFLNDEPIRARRASLLDKSRKWSRRHRPLVRSAALAFVVTLTGLGGSVGWVLRDRAAREAMTVAAAETALREAQRSAQQEKWRAALAAVEGAESLLPQPSGSEDLRRRLRDFRSDVEMIIRLNDVRMTGITTHLFQRTFFEADRGYAAAFRDHGIDVETLSTSDAARLIAVRPLRAELAAALDGWADTRRRNPEAGRKAWQELLQVAQAADPDSQRVALRSAVLREDRQALLTAAHDADRLSTRTLSALGIRLWLMGCEQEAIDFLRRAQQQHPDDFWINFQLGNYLARQHHPDLTEAIRFQSIAAALRPEFPSMYLNLGLTLTDSGRHEEALSAFRRVLGVNPGCAEAHCNIGVDLWRQNKRQEAVAEFRRALELDPALVQANFNLGNALAVLGRFDEAMQSYRRATAAAPDFASAHAQLGGLLRRVGRNDEAIAELRQALTCKLRPVDRVPPVNTYVNLVGALLAADERDEAAAVARRAVGLPFQRPQVAFALAVRLGELGLSAESEAAYRRVIALKHDYAEAYCNLGQTLNRQGRFTEALAALCRGHELSSTRANWRYPSQKWVRMTERYVALARDVDAVIKGKLQPASAAECAEYAEICFLEKRYLPAAKLFERAFRDDAALADDFANAGRYDAACAAALAAAGRGIDTGWLSDLERAQWRRQAIAWLQAELALDRKLVTNGSPDQRRRALDRLRDWPIDSDLVSLRQPAALVKLSAVQQQACRQIWSEIKSLTQDDSAVARSESPRGD